MFSKVIFHLSPEYLHHFNTLSCAIRILSHKTDCVTNNALAKQLLTFFVTKSRTLYGDDFLIYNTHNLLHLSDDVLKFGQLDLFSAFSFESYLNSIKKKLRKGEKPLQQLHHRLEERANCLFEKKIDNGLKPPEASKFNSRKSKHSNKQCYDKINYGEFTLSTRQICDTFCYIEGYEIFRINNILIENDGTFLEGETLINAKNLEHYPIESKLIHIVVGSIWSESKIINANIVLSKAVCVPCEDKTFYYFPLIHSSD